MCTLALAFHAHSNYPIILASNRDEFYARPSRAAQFWEDAPTLLAGKDLRGGGTWLGVTKSGRFATLTNVRAGFDERTDAPSRGEIVREYLLSNQTPLEFAHSLAQRAHAYNGFNLLAGSLESAVIYSNRSGVARELAPGVYSLSNAVPEVEWPKTRRARMLLEGVLARDDVRVDALFELLGDADHPPDAHLPDTGVGAEWERVLSSIFIRTPDYGTCASTVFLVTDAGEATFVERSPDMAGSESVEVRELIYHFNIQGPTAPDT